MLPFVRSLRDAFGAERLMWATDCPYQLYQHYPACEPAAFGPQPTSASLL